jgi:hypothetical protein
MQIKIATVKATKVTLTFSELAATNKSNRTISISANTIYTITFTEEERIALYMAGTTTKQAKKSLHITSTESVSVYAVNKLNLSLDATNVLPADALGTDYYHISYKVNLIHMDPFTEEGSYKYGQDAMTIVAAEEGTTVIKYGGYTEKLNKGEVLYMPSNVDMTGMHVTSDKSIAYFVTHKGAGIPEYTEDKLNAETLFQQLAPVNSWGTHFFVPDIGKKEQFPLLARVVASQDGTVVKLDGGTVKDGSLSLDKGQFVTFKISDTGCFVSSNKPVEVCSYLLSYPEITVNPKRGGSAMTWIPPLEQGIISTIIPLFNVSQSYALAHYAVIVTPAGTKGQTTVDGKVLDDNSCWVTRKGYAYTVYSFTNSGYVTDYNPHTLSNPNGLTALVTGLSYDDGYYYLGGSSILNLNMMFTVNGQHYKDIFGKMICSKDIALKATILYADCKKSGYLKWYIDGKEEPSATDNLEWNTTLAAGAHTIKMEVLDLNGQRESVSTDIVVETSVQASDLRILMAPSNAQHSVYLTSFIDTAGVISVKWTNPQNYAPAFSDDATGELDAQTFLQKAVYTYIYTVTSKCGVSSAKAYVLTSKGKLPVKNNREISVCKEFELSKNIQLNRILGLEDSGQWSYPNDTNGIIDGNVTVSSSKYADARIFNAQRAYAEAVKANSHNYAGNPDIKTFLFSFTSVEGAVYEFSVIVS